jgi:CRP-like cAMP-binding protein
MEPMKNLQLPAKREVPPKLFEALKRIGHRRPLKSGEVLFQEGDEGGSLFLVESGGVFVYRSMQGEREESIGWIQANEILGEIEFTDGGPRVFSARALEDTLAWEIQRVDLDKSEEGPPEMFLEFCVFIDGLLGESLRLINDLYKREMIRGIETSGTRLWGWQHLLMDSSEVEVHLSDGEILKGMIIVVLESESGFEMTIMEKNGNLVCIPYGSISTLKSCA